MRKAIPEASFLILVALSDQELHGYGIIGEVKQLSGDRLKLGPGTLYGTLDRLSERGLIQQLSERGLIQQTETKIVDGRVRHYYGITGMGLEAVRDEAAARSDTMRAVTRHLQPRGRGALA